MADTENKRHSCEVCQKQFTQTCNLKRHMLTHSGIKSHICEKCKKQFAQACHLKRHMLTHTGIKLHHCDVCQKKFSLAHDLKRHILTHTGIRPHQCNVCLKQFSLAHDLKHHMLIHTGVRPHECDVCKKKFFRVYDLKQHMFSHTGIRPYKCEMCKKEFFRTYDLKQHMFIHTGIRTHKCDLCKKEFFRAYDLKHHMVIHTGIRPHPCEVCKKKFTNSCNLKQHMLTHSGIMSNNKIQVIHEKECSQCCELFECNTDLKRHISVKHTGDKTNKVCLPTINIHKHSDICDNEFELPSTSLYSDRESHDQPSIKLEQVEQNKTGEYEQSEFTEIKTSECSESNDVRKVSFDKILPFHIKTETECPDYVNSKCMIIEPVLDSSNNTNASGMSFDTDLVERGNPEINQPAVKHENQKLSLHYEDQSIAEQQCFSGEDKSESCIVNSDEYGLKGAHD